MIIVLNGPPGCGKDTLAQLLTAYGFTRTEFKHDLYVKTAEYYGIPLSVFKERHENRELKELPFKQGLSTRQMLIHVSENVCKPTHGQDYFGRLAAARCAEIEGDIVFSDGGFEEEVKALGDNVMVIRLHREGFTFDGDSRNYLSEGIDVTLIDDNPNAAVKEILHHAKMFRANK